MLNRNFFPVTALVALVMAALSVGGCGGTRAAYSAASKAPDSVEQTATVVAEHYYALVKEAADLKQAGALTGSALEDVRAADNAAKPLVIELTRVADAYRAVRSADNELALQTALNDAVLAVNRFITALKAR